MLRRHAPYVPRPARAALVVAKPKPKHAFTRADFNFVAAQQLFPRAQRQQLEEPHLVGIWDDMELDPTAWGTEPSQSLLSLTVRIARQRLQHRAFLDRAAHLPGYGAGGALWPRLWSRGLDAPPDPNEIILSPGQNPLLQADGIHGEEARWCLSAAEDPEEGPPTEGRGEAPPWMTLRETGEPAAGPSSQARSARAARRREPQAAPQLPPPALALRPDFPEVWKRLRDPTLHRPFRITCWRMLHARLGCNAFLYHVRKSGSPLCSHPACAAAGDVETLTHAFLLCPAVLPVIYWMLGTWRRLAGVELPRAPELILADDPSHGWPVGAGRPAFRLWTRLRVATLGAIWQARCSRGTYQASFARHAVTLAVDSLLQAIRRDWRRTQEDPRLLDNGAFCNDWWRGFDARLKVGDFERQWALPPVFCGLEGARPPAGADDHRRLEMKLGRDRPLARPP